MRGHGYVPGAVSVVVVCWNHADLTQNCMESIIGCRDQPNEIILVNNASEDETEDVIHKYQVADDRVEVATLTQNVGWGRGANIGAQLAEGEFILHLNNDTEVHDNWLTPLVSEMADSQVCAVAGTLLNADGTTQHTGTRLFFDSSGTLTAENITDNYTRRDVDCLSLAAALVRADAWNHVGGVDPIFWCGYEDVDFCLRARANGLKLRYTPDSVVTHLGHGSGEARWAHTGDNIANLHNRWAKLLSPNAD